jgi:hypothetical protein
LFIWYLFGMDLGSLSGRALEVLGELLESDEPLVRLGAVREVMRLRGLGGDTGRPVSVVSVLGMEALRGLIAAKLGDEFVSRSVVSGVVELSGSGGVGGGSCGDGEDSCDSCDVVIEGVVGSGDACDVGSEHADAVDAERVGDVGGAGFSGIGSVMSAERESEQSERV